MDEFITLAILDKQKNMLYNWSWPYELEKLINIIEKYLNNEVNDYQNITLAEMEHKLIMKTLNLTNNNRTHAADILGINVRTLRNKLKEYRHMQGVL